MAHATAGLAPRPTGADAKRLERSITIATIIELVAAFVLPTMSWYAAGRPDLTLPSHAITIGPLLLWIDHELATTRYRIVGWALTVGPIVSPLPSVAPHWWSLPDSPPQARSYWSAPRPGSTPSLASRSGQGDKEAWRQCS